MLEAVNLAPSRATQVRILPHASVKSGRVKILLSALSIKTTKEPEEKYLPAIAWSDSDWQAGRLELCFWEKKIFHKIFRKEIQ